MCDSFFVDLEDVELVKVGNDAGDQTVEREDENNAADDAIDEPHGADVKVGAHLIDKEGDNRPPYQGSKDNEGIAEDDMVELVLRQWEAETGEQWDNQEHDERITQCEKEARDHVSPVVVALFDILFDLTDGVVDDHVNGIDNQDDTANDLQHINVVGDKISHQRDTQPHQQAIKQVAGSSTNAREEARMTSIVQSALDAEDADRSHGCRQNDTY